MLTVATVTTREETVRRSSSSGKKKIFSSQHAVGLDWLNQSSQLDMNRYWSDKIHYEDVVKMVLLPRKHVYTLFGGLILACLFSFFGPLLILYNDVPSELKTTSNTPIKSAVSTTDATKARGSSGEQVHETENETSKYVAPQSHMTSTNEKVWWSPFVQDATRKGPWFQPASMAMSQDPFPWCHLMNASTFHVLPPKGHVLKGIVYVKTHKSSSSTCEGINMAIAHHVGRRVAANQTTSAFQKKCEHYNRHEFANARLQGQVMSTTKPSSSSSTTSKKSTTNNTTRACNNLLWTFVRYPPSRDLSHVYHFRVSRQHLDPNKSIPLLLEALENQKSYQTNYLVSQPAFDTIQRWRRHADFSPSQDAYAPRVAFWMRKEILESYDFIGLTERMMESLAVMTLLWDLHPTDVIVLSAKQAGGKHSYDSGGKKKKCTPLVKPAADTLLPLREYMRSEAYQKDHLDFLLYEAVESALDRTIVSLGHAQVQERSKLLKQLQNLADENCFDKAIFPCSGTGVYQGDLAEGNCYVQDAGCGYPCVDELMQQYRQGHIQLP